jgi:glycosyltransferase involved in cell wall biosynthesis
MPDALFCACNAWDSPGHVGSHQLARCLLDRGWRVAFVSDPVSPLHALGGMSVQLRERFALFRSGGRWVNDALWTWVPGALLTPHNKPLLRMRSVQFGWSAMAFPRPQRQLRRAGFGAFDLVYVDSITQGFWWRSLPHKRAVFRLADNPAGFARHTPAAQLALEDLTRAVDLVTYTTPALGGLAQSLGARRTLLLPNGVDFVRFAKPASAPVEYAGETRPIVLYVGAMAGWLHTGWLRAAARALPDHLFVLIGPGERERSLEGIDNVRLLGPRPHDSLPGYMQHASVGVIPFDTAAQPELVHGINPLKLYEYMAAGLPVVASRWRALETLGSPAVLADDEEGFARAISQAPSAPFETACRFAQAFDWGPRADALLKSLELAP